MRRTIIIMQQITVIPSDNNIVMTVTTIDISLITVAKTRIKIRTRVKIRIEVKIKISKKIRILKTRGLLTFIVSRQIFLRSWSKNGPGQGSRSVRTQMP